FNPWTRGVRADQGGPRAWNHGGWSGAEWVEPAEVPFTVKVLGTDAGSWLALHQQLAKAFAPSSVDVELRFTLGGREYVMFGRPRGINPSPIRLGVGEVFTDCRFGAPDPNIYSGQLHSTDPIPLPTQVGGLTVPFAAPFSVPGMVIGGRVDLLNEGTTEAGLVVRIDGPVTEPRLTLQRPDGAIQSVTWHGLTIPAGQFLIVDTAARQAFLNGDQASAAHPGHADWPLLQAEATSVLRFNAAEHDDGKLVAQWRDAWWS
ncbi:MAG: hypothetical protein ACRD0W_24020, partial [Acidimicrobiales bacterium]